MPSKKSRVRLYADENIPIPTVTYLRTKGVSIMHAYDVNFVNKKDDLHLKKSQALKRVLLSLDKDFRKFENASLKNHPGVLLITSGNNTPKHINKILDKVLKNVTEEYLKHGLVRATIDKLVRKKSNSMTEKFI